MNVLSFLLKYSKRNVAIAITTGVISGTCNVALLALIHRTLSNQGASGKGIVLAFVALCLTLPISRVISQSVLNYLAQNAIFDLRLKLSRKILAAPVRNLEEIGPHRLLAALTDDVGVITNGLISIPILCLHGAILIGCMIYLCWLSPKIFLFVLGFIIFGMVAFRMAVMKATRFMKSAREDQDRLYSHLRGLTQGTKELKLHQRRRNAFLTDLLERTASSYRRHNVTGTTIFIAAGSTAQLLFFTLLGLLLFVVPTIWETSYQLLTGFTLTLLYMQIPLDMITTLLPNLGRTSVALSKVESLGLSLASGASEDLELGRLPNRPFNTVELSEVTHTYRHERDDGSFRLGPISLTFRPGEVVFLVGGNGSGKTTLAKLLTGLYSPEDGQITIDDQPVTDRNRELYRQRFSVVFSDFYLFDSLLGLDSPGLDNQARNYLAQLELDQKVQVKDGALSTIDLSQGQRKRLALLTAYLEDRPFYVFDEWAADQDPAFKQVFYLSLLPELKARGKAVVVISHDDRYYHVADRIVKLDYGKLVSDDRVWNQKEIAAPSR